MAQVIRIEERLAKLPKRQSEPHEAQILLFTGVQYERWTTAGDHPQKRSSDGKRKKN